MKKRKIAVLIGLFACALLALGLAACGHEHTWDGGEVTTPATCTEAGLTTYACTVCAATRTEPISATGHSYAKEWSSDNTHHWHEATCGHDVVSGRNEHFYEAGVCRLCGAPQPVTEGQIGK